MERIASLEDVPDLLTPQDLLRILPVGRSTLYKILRDSSFPAKKIGRKILISKKALIRWLEEN